MTCTATGPSGSTFSNWKFSDGTHTVNGSGTSNTWSGKIVTSGTLSVTVTSNGQSPVATAQVTVNPRSWHLGAASPVEVANGTFLVLPVPPAPSGDDAGLGESQELTGNSAFSVSFISDNGPNDGYGYYATMPGFQTSYRYEINPDLENTGSDFYQHQCGNYSPSNPSGYISGSNLLTQTRRHEYNSPTESHYVFYESGLQGNNPGDYVESRIAAPRTSGSTFDTTTASGLNQLYQSIFDVFSVQPFLVNDDGLGNFLGNINYAPYASCN